ncbi:hypothetical protein BMS3Abin10_01650 [bacterium BMS3Abin10]|nr:hypothetical protein BMS3Abin10_01650 [bacterium BMS3Abin10]
MSDAGVLILFVLGAGAIYLCTRRWFWKVAFFFGALASLFSMLASIIHFQILGALGFFVLMIVCWFIFQALLEG